MEKNICPRSHFDKRSSVECLIDFLNSTVGRDKLFRFIQYYAKFIVPFLKTNEKYAKIAQFIESLGNTMNTVRKVRRYK